MSSTIDTGIEQRQVSATTPGLDARQLRFTDIPLIDFAAMHGVDDNAKQALAREIHRACTDVGFFYIRNHGVTDALIKQAQVASRRFFALDVADKMAIDVSRSAFNRGYIPLYGEKNNATARGDIKETFDMAIDVGPGDADFQAGNPLYGPNQWPQQLPEFRTALDGYFAAMSALSRQLYQAFALALALPEEHFLPLLNKPLDICRLLRYPPQPVVDDPDQIGTGAHSDFDCFTILWQDPTGGLQALNQAGEWIDAQPIDGALLINVGDMLERWTNGRFVSTVHRVINRAERERYSMVFFAAPDYHTRIECLPSCCGPDEPARYSPVGAGDYIISRYDEILAADPDA